MVYSAEKKVHRVRQSSFAVVMGFLLLWFVGVALGEPDRVMELARQVCLSCIGLG